MKRSISTLPRGAAAFLLSAAALLTACGGGEQTNEFRASRIRAFGDESSVIAADGRKYTVNALVSGGSAVDCTAHPIWVQEVARNYGLVFPQCNPAGVAAPAGLILATPGAKAADVKTQIDTYLASDNFRSNDIVTIMAGANDVLELYAQFPGQSADALVAAAEARGAQLAVQVNRVALAGPRVVIATVFRQGQTPFGRAQNAAAAGRADLLNRLSLRFNARLRADIINDGRKIALIRADDRVDNIVAQPGDFSFSNVNDAACLPSAPLPNCTTATLVAGGNAGSWLWADATHLSAGGQFRIGEIAVEGVNNNPF